ncbi:MAG: YoaK family protein [Acidimicrobiia bacterium]|nr:YoaK family protein [Acidimicrobiia bacterium]
MEHRPSHEGTLLPPAVLPPRGRVRVATGLLGFVAGYADAIGFLTLFGIFTAHQSGNTTHFGVSVGAGDWTDAVVRLFPIPMFVIAIALGTTIVEVLRRPRARGGRAPDAAPRGAVRAAGGLHGARYVGGRDLPPRAGATVVLHPGRDSRHGDGRADRGVATRRPPHRPHHLHQRDADPGRGGRCHVAVPPDRREAPRSRPRRAGRARCCSPLGVWASFAVGAILGALVHRPLDLWALVVPIGVLAALAVYEGVAGLAVQRR